MSGFLSSVALVFLPIFMAIFLFFSICVCLSARPPVPLSGCLDVYLCNMSISLSVKQTSFCVHLRRRSLVIVVVVVVDFAL